MPQPILSSGQNPLATEKITKLIAKFAVPAIVAGLVSALYNIVDQIFIGQGVGLLGNAATNVAFPLTTICTALSLLLGIGGAARFNLHLGAGEKEKAACVAGNAVTMILLAGVSLCAVVITFLQPLLVLFGASPDVLPYAKTYTSITAFGIPLLLLSSGGCQLIRADGSPTYSMLCMMSGAILNTILDPIFIFGFGMGMAGAAAATVIGQAVSAAMVVAYLLHFKTVKLTRARLRLRADTVKSIVSLGAAPCFNQFAMVLVQITMNNSLRYYGGLSPYGSEIPLACVGVITKLNIVFMACTIGIAQGCQPIFGYNYGAGNLARVRKTFLTAAVIETVISSVSFILFQFFPRQIISIFGQGNEAYFAFATRYLRIYMFLVFLIGFQQLCSNFFTAIGKAKLGIMMSLTRQIIFLLPLILIFPIFMGIDGIMYAGPIADAAAVLLAAFFAVRELRKMR